MRAPRYILTFALSFCLGACTTLAAEQTEARTAYLAQQLDCVDQNATKAAIDACRAKVKAAWAAADAQAEAGGEAGK